MKVLKLRKEGESLNSLARKFGVSPQRIILLVERETKENKRLEAVEKIVNNQLELMGEKFESLRIKFRKDLVRGKRDAITVLTVKNIRKLTVKKGVFNIPFSITGSVVSVAKMTIELLKEKI